MRFLVGLVLASLLLSASAALASESPPPRWAHAASPWPGDVVHALALDASRERLAFGGERGVRIVGGGSEVELARGPVRDLAFLPGGALLVATDDGVYRIDPGGGHTREPIGPGAESRRVSRIAAGPGGVAAAATEAGVALRDASGRWSRRAELPLRPALFVALRARGADVELWCVVGDELWVSVFSAGDPSRGGSARRVALPGVGEEVLPSDAVFDLPEADVALLLPTGFAVQGADGAWRLLRSVWPPGATPKRVGVARGLRWLATDAGLLSAQDLSGPWQRAGTPAGEDATLALAAAGDEVVVATPHEVLRAGARAAAPPPRDAMPVPVPPVGPDVRAVQRAALAYVELGPGIAHSLRTRVGRRGWLPVVSVRAGLDSDEVSTRAWDQSFVSGATRDLLDGDHRQGEGYSVDVTLAWDLGDIVFDPDEVDVSRELRSVIALRDDVLDEVTQLYFERRRAIAQLASGAASAPEAEALRLRAAELAAGIDAWTGGWFTRALLGPGTPRPGESE
jgi:hypothetical protein